MSAYRQPNHWAYDRMRIIPIKYEVTNVLRVLVCIRSGSKRSAASIPVSNLNMVKFL
jgi:hypothetical protein